VTDTSLGAAEMSALAARVLRRSLHVRASENVTIETWNRSLPWTDAFVVETRRLGARPLVLYESDSALWETAQGRLARGLGTLGNHELALLDASDAWVYLPGPSEWNRGRAGSAAVRRIIDQWDEQWFRAARRGGLRACRVEVAGVDQESGMAQGVDPAVFRRELVEGSNVDPETIRRAARGVARRLGRARRLTISHPNGTRLELGLRQRRVVVEDGTVSEEDLRAGRNMAVLPDGKLAVSLDEHVAEGVFCSNRPSRHFRGTFEDARWTFHSGHLVQHETGRGGEVFEETYQAAGRERDRPALLSIGLNPKIHDAPFYEEIGRGVVCFYIGCNNDFGGRTGGPYRDYALIEGAEVALDGRVVLHNGEFA
jgi:leucyl aminopeptidase (aminopeptidase T)